MSNLINVTMGGVKQNLRVELGIATAIEAEAGRSILSITDEMLSAKGRLGDVVLIYKHAHRALGIEYDDAKCLELIAADGLFNAMATAATIIGQLFVGPDDSTAGKGQSRRKKTSASNGSLPANSSAPAA